MSTTTTGDPFSRSMASDGLGLGIDAGGTATRWALARADGSIAAEGQVEGLHGRIFSAEDRARSERTLQAIVAAARIHGRVGHVVAGITGFEPVSEGHDVVQAALAQGLGLQHADLALSDDMLTTYLAAFLPGEGYLVYAGTGSMAAYVDAQGQLHRVGGLGYLLDDAGGGFWIAVEALRRVWRREESTPGAWRDSPLAGRLFAAMGGNDWPATRAFVYSRERGEIGTLARQVGASGDDDLLAQEILRDAGTELARLANLHLQQHGPRPVALAGGIAQLHPRLLEAMRASLCAEVPLQVQSLQSHHRAAQLAAEGPVRIAELRRIRSSVT